MTSAICRRPGLKTLSFSEPISSKLCHPARSHFPVSESNSKLVCHLASGDSCIMLCLMALLHWQREKALRCDAVSLITFYSHPDLNNILPSHRAKFSKVWLKMQAKIGCKISQWLTKTNKRRKKRRYVRDLMVSKSRDAPGRRRRMFPYGFCHVSRSHEHVRFSEAGTRAKVISTAGVLGEYSKPG